MDGWTENMSIETVSFKNYYYMINIHIYKELV